MNFETKTSLVRPFVPIDDPSNRIALVPGFTLGVNSEENILRACAQRSHQIHGNTTSTKEEEYRELFYTEFSFLSARIGRKLLARMKSSFFRKR